MTAPLPPEFRGAQAECLAVLAASREAILPLPARRLLLRSMGVSRLLPGSRRAIITPGLERRTALQIMSTEKVLARWELRIGSDDPRTMLVLAQRYLAGSVDYDHAHARQHAFGGALLNVGSLPEQKIGVVYVGYAALDAVLTALQDGDLADDGCDDEDRDVYTGELCACAAYSGDLPWGELSSGDRRREFWDWWLTVAAPRAYASVSE